MAACQLEDEVVSSVGSVGPGFGSTALLVVRGSVVT